MIKTLMLLGALTFGASAGVILHEEEQPIVEPVEEEEDIDFDDIIEKIKEGDYEEAIKDALTEWLGDTFTPEVIGYITLGITGFITSFITVIKLIAAKKIKVKNNDELVAEVVKANEEAVKNEVQNQLVSSVANVLKTCDNLQKTTKVLAEVITLMQQNTPESKIACIQLLEQFAQVSADITTEAKKVVENQVAEQKAKKEQVLQEIESMKSEYDGTNA